MAWSSSVHESGESENHCDMTMENDQVRELGKSLGFAKRVIKLTGIAIQMLNLNLSRRLNQMLKKHALLFQAGLGVKKY